MEKLEVTLGKSEFHTINSFFFEIVFDFYTSDIVMGKVRRQRKEIIYVHIVCRPM